MNTCGTIEESSMARILVTYATMAGSTAEVAQVVADTISDQLGRDGNQVAVRPIHQAGDPADYDAVIVGGPMIMGWHREALGYLKRHRRVWSRVPVAVFVQAISLTDTGERSINGVPVTVDDRLPKPPADPARLTFRERYACLPNYLRPILKATRPARPAAIGVFGGRLEYGRLKWWAVLFVQVIIQAPAGDRRNWPAIRAWAAGLPAALGLIDAVHDTPREAFPEPIVTG
jgi:menaquinone-dependent protoporphyrinogen oxidase